MRRKECWCKGGEVGMRRRSKKTSWVFLVRGVEDRIWERIRGRNVAIDGAVTGGDEVSVRLGMGGGHGVVGIFLNKGRERVVGEL